jgi:hypothetical protein
LTVTNPYDGMTLLWCYKDNNNITNPYDGITLLWCYKDNN